MKIERRTIPVEIPTASMADVAFLLIIFFLVTSLYSVTRGIQFFLPRQEWRAAVGSGIRLRSVGFWVAGYGSRFAHEK